MSPVQTILSQVPAEAAMQTWLALAVVAVCAVWLTLRLFGKARKGSDCGGGGCGAVSKDVRKLQVHIKKRSHGGAFR